MPTIQCPHCRHEARVPSLDKIGGKNVKCPSCGQKFYVEPPAPEIPKVESNEFAFRGPVPEFTPPETPRANPPRRSPKGESLFRPLSYDPNGATSEARYPNLMRYIALSETLNTLLFRLGLALIVIGLAIGEVAAIIQLIQGELEAILGMILMPLIAALAALSLWLYFIFYMAVTEFIRVVVDTENNTRH